jgi:hypothetical protein
MTPIAYRRWLLLVLLAVLATWAVRSGRIVVPDAWNPWAPLDVDAPPNLLTRFKLSRASSDRVACRVALEQATMRFASLDDRVTGPGCGFDNALRIERTSVGVGEPFALSCRAALSLAMWERHVLQQAAVAQLGSRVMSLEHYGSYACRNVYDDPGRRRSQHATADAFDIAGFVLQDGRRIRVVNDWMPHAGEAIAAAAPTEGSMAADARFLRAVRDGACRYFDAVLGPDYNRAHADHFHFDRGAARICR